MRFRALAWVVLSCGLNLCALGCQKQDDHPPYAPGCQVGCAPVAGIAIGPGTTATPPTEPVGDAGTGALTGQVRLLSDDAFVTDSLFNKTAVISADGASGTIVTGNWDGVDTYSLTDVALEATNWVSVKPDDVQGDALATYQPLATNSVTSAPLRVVSGAALDAVFSSVAAPRTPDFGQVILFFQSQGTNAGLSGLHVSMAAAQVAAYSSSKGWIQDDGTAVTDATGLVVFGNVDSTLANNGVQTVTFSQTATGTSAAVPGGTFAIKVVEGAVTIGNVDVQL